jgi:CubicO group peptidase (beta-lactamase class C family)
MHRCRRSALTVGLVLSLLVVASAPAQSATGVVVAVTPGSTWEHVPPAVAGLDAAKLGGIAQDAKQGDSNCFLVERDGKIATESYFRGTGPTSSQEVFSVTKSITSTLVGIAQDEGDLHVTDSASKWIDEWRGTPAAAVTVRDLLSNDSGRAWSTRIDYVRLLHAPDRTAFAVGLRQTSAPGEVWAYNNSAIQTLQRVLAKATGQDVVAFARTHLFAPLGMTHTRMTRDAAGNAQTFAGVHSTCRDLARFGLLMLEHGRWGDRQVVSSEWVSTATGKSSTPLNAAYGYLWWLNRPGVIANPLVAVSRAEADNPTTRTGKVAPEAPDDMFWALGLGSQLVQVDPGSRTVVVRLGPPSAGAGAPAFDTADAAQVVTDAVVH